MTYCHDGRLIDLIRPTSFYRKCFIFYLNSVNMCLDTVFYVSICHNMIWRISVFKFKIGLKTYLFNLSQKLNKYVRGLLLIFHYQI